MRNILLFLIFAGFLLSLFLYVFFAIEWWVPAKHPSFREFSIFILHCLGIILPLAFIK